MCTLEPCCSRSPCSAVVLLLENRKSWETSGFPAVRGLCALECQNVCDQRKQLENPFNGSRADQLRHSKQTSRCPSGSGAAHSSGTAVGRDDTATVQVHYLHHLLQHCAHQPHKEMCPGGRDAGLLPTPPPSGNCRIQGSGFHFPSLHQITQIPRSQPLRSCFG